MQITNIRAAKKFTRNLGDYQSASAELELTAAIAEGEDANACVDELFGLITARIQAELGLPVETEAPTAPAPATAPAAPSPSPTPEMPTAATTPTPPVAGLTPLPDAAVPATVAPAPAATMDPKVFEEACIPHICTPEGPVKVGALLQKYGADRIGTVPAERRAEFLAELQS